MLIRYQAQDKPNTIEPTLNRGVSSLLQGTRSAIIPEGNERMARRKSLQVVDTKTAEEEQGECCGHDEELPLAKK
jgi:hypothetical protein